MVVCGRFGSLLFALPLKLQFLQTQQLLALQLLLFLLHFLFAAISFDRWKTLRRRRWRRCNSIIIAALLINALAIEIRASIAETRVRIESRVLWTDVRHNFGRVGIADKVLGTVGRTGLTGARYAGEHLDLFATVIAEQRRQRLLIVRIGHVRVAVLNDTIVGINS